MELFLFIIAIIGWIGCVYYKGKAKEFEGLFELSKEYETTGSVFMPHAQSIGKVDGVTIVSSTDGNKSYSIKLNKDGSIAKKRGRKSNVKTT